MDDLPDEILVYILSYFQLKTLHHRLAKVCRRWQLLITETAVLNKLFVVEDEDDLRFMTTLKNVIYLKVLNIKIKENFIESILDDIIKCCPNLTSLTIHRCNSLSEYHLFKINKYFIHLRHIDVFLSSRFISLQFIEMLKQMKSVVLNNRVNFDTFKLIMENCPYLTDVHMYGFVQYYPTRQLQRFIISKFNQLRSISLRCYEVNDKTCYFLSQCSHLRNLRLYHCWLITDKGLDFLSILKNIQTLHITGLKLITRKGFGTFINKLDMTNLLELNFSSSIFNDDHALILSKKTNNLRVLELWKCKLTLEGLYSIISKLKNLYILDLDMELPEILFEKITAETNIKYVIFSKGQYSFVYSTEGIGSGKPQAFEYCEKLAFRGNSEGFRANLLCYSHQFQFPNYQIRYYCNDTIVNKDSEYRNFIANSKTNASQSFDEIS